MVGHGSKCYFNSAIPQPVLQNAQQSMNHPVSSAILSTPLLPPPATSSSSASLPSYRYFKLMEFQVITRSPEHEYAIDPAFQLYHILPWITASLSSPHNVSQDQAKTPPDIIWQLCRWAQQRQCKHLQNTITI